MKRISLFIITTVLLWTGLQAQIFTVSDTTPCFERQRNYFYYTWFDTARWYLNSKDTLWFNQSQNELIPQWLYHLNDINETPDSTQTPPLHFFGQYTSRPLKIKGLWAMVDKNPLEHDRWPVSNYSRAAEYLYLYTVDSNEPYIDTVDWYYDSYFLKRINGARWDTNQPRMLCIPAYVDGHAPYNRFRDEYCPAYQYCYLYEAHFDSAVTVEGEFWIAGTYNSNIQGRPLPVWLHYPTEYLSWGAMTGRRYKILSGPVDGPWRRGDYDYTLQLQAGPFGVITDYQWFVHAATADSAQGMALGTDYCTDSTQVTISAVPNRGFRFLHWNDGNTDNPRSILVTQDTLFTAFFEPLERYSVSTDCNFPYCFVAGDSVYYEGDTATLMAKGQPALRRRDAGHRFHRLLRRAAGHRHAQVSTPGFLPHPQPGARHGHRRPRLALRHRLLPLPPRRLRPRGADHDADCRLHLRHPPAPPPPRRLLLRHPLHPAGFLHAETHPAIASIVVGHRHNRNVFGLDMTDLR